MKHLMITAALALTACQTVPPGLTQESLWEAGSDRVMLTQRGTEQGLPELSGIAYRGYGTPCTWKALQVAPGRWMVSMESTGRWVPLTQEFEATALTLGEEIMARLPAL